MGENIYSYLGYTNPRSDRLSRKMALEDSMLRVQLHLHKSCVVSNISIDYFEKILKQHDLFDEDSFGKGGVDFHVGKGDGGHIAVAFVQDNLFR